MLYLAYMEMAIVLEHKKWFSACGGPGFTGCPLGESPRGAPQGAAESQAQTNVASFELPSTLTSPQVMLVSATSPTPPPGFLWPALANFLPSP